MFLSQQGKIRIQFRKHESIHKKLCSPGSSTYVGESEIQIPQDFHWIFMGYSQSLDNVWNSGFCV